MKIDEITIERSRAMPTQRILRITSGGRTFEGYFDDLMAFFRACYGAMAYFGQAAGLVEIQPGGKIVSKKA